MNSKTSRVIKRHFDELVTGGTAGAAHFHKSVRDKDHQDQAAVVEQVAMPSAGVSPSGPGDANLAMEAAGTAVQESATTKQAKKSQQKSKQKSAGATTEDPETGDRLDLEVDAPDVDLGDLEVNVRVLLGIEPAVSLEVLVAEIVLAGGTTAFLWSFGEGVVRMLVRMS